MNLILRSVALMAVIFPVHSVSITDENEGTPYGVDCTFPIHYKNLRCGDLLGDRSSVYEEYMQGCYDTFDKNTCDDYENDRIAMSLRQPAGMVNYTSTGFKKIKAPEKLFKLLKDHWDQNNHLKREEVWGRGNIYVSGFISHLSSTSNPD